MASEHDHADSGGRAGGHVVELESARRDSTRSPTQATTRGDDDDRSATTATTTVHDRLGDSTTVAGAGVAANVGRIVPWPNSLVIAAAPTTPSSIAGDDRRAGDDQADDVLRRRCRRSSLSDVGRGCVTIEREGDGDDRRSTQFIRIVRSLIHSLRRRRSRRCTRRGRAAGTPGRGAVGLAGTRPPASRSAATARAARRPGGRRARRLLDRRRRGPRCVGVVGRATRGAAGRRSASRERRRAAGCAPAPSGRRGGRRSRSTEHCSISRPWPMTTRSSAISAISDSRWLLTKHRPALTGEVDEHVADPADALGVEAVGRLVEDDRVRVAEQHAGQAEPLAHAERVAVRTRRLGAPR